MEFFKNLKDVPRLDQVKKRCKCGSDYSVTFYDGGCCPDCARKDRKTTQRLVERCSKK